MGTHKMMVTRTGTPLTVTSTTVPRPSDGTRKVAVDQSNSAETNRDPRDLRAPAGSRIGGATGGGATSIALRGGGAKKASNFDVASFDHIRQMLTSCSRVEVLLLISSVRFLRTSGRHRSAAGPTTPSFHITYPFIPPLRCRTRLIEPVPWRECPPQFDHSSSSSSPPSPPSVPPTAQAPSSECSLTSA